MARILTPLISSLFICLLLSISSCSEVMEKYQIDEAIKQCKDHGGLKKLKLKRLIILLL